jgi:cytochrome P450
MSNDEAASPTPSVSSRAFWSRTPVERASTFAELRRSAPISLQAPSDFGGVRPERGFWAVTRHAEVVQVSRNAETFCSGQGVGLGNVPIDLLELNASFLVMDAPRHTALRRVVSGAFTPKRVAQLEERIQAEAGRIVDDFVDSGGGDVVDDLAGRLPLWTICEMMGVPDSMRGDLYSAAETQITGQDPDVADPAAVVKAAMTMHDIAADLVEARRASPGDDILSTLVHSRVDGEPLSDRLLGGIFALFSTAGNDTTRSTTAHAMKLFADSPAQWKLLAGDRTLIGTAVEEMVRCATPVIHFRRTATTDTTLGNVPIAAGDAVVMFYESANRDEAVFSAPERFDIARNPNPHVGFGGGGPHFCLGASLARAQLRALFSRLSERVSTIEVGNPSYVVSNFVNSMKRMSVSVVAR